MYSRVMGFENGRVLRVNLRATRSPSMEQVNTFHYDIHDSDLTLKCDPQKLADAFRDDVRPAFAALYSAAWQIEPVVIVEERDPQDPNAPRSEWVSGSAGVGGRALATESLPHAMCGVATLKTQHIGRRFTGRLFLGGELVEGDQSTGQWLPAITGLWTTYLNAVPKSPDITDAVEVDRCLWSVYSRTQRTPDAAHPAGEDPYLSKIVSMPIRPNVHWLRSRDD